MKSKRIASIILVAAVLISPDEENKVVHYRDIDGGEHELKYG